jgi:hypothetical protein
MSNRVRWTAEEWAHLRTVAVNRLYEYPGADNAMLLRMGQSLLPDGRQRKITPQVIFSMKDFFNEIRQEVAQNPKERKQPPVLVEGPRPVSDVEKNDSLEVILNMLVDKIADKVAERLAAQLQVHVNTTTTTHSEHRPRHNPEPPCNAPREPKVGVLILGMQPHQGNIIKQEFPMLDITCYDSDEARTKQVIMRKHTIGMTRFLSHQVEDRYRKCPRYHRHATGVSELKTLLKQIAEGTV